MQFNKISLLPLALTPTPTPNGRGAFRTLLLWEKGRVEGWRIRYSLLFGIALIFLLPLSSVFAQEPPPPIYAVPDADEFTPLVSQPFAVLRSGLVAVVNPDFASVGIVDLAERTLVSEISVGANPVAIALTSDNARLYVASAIERAIYIIDVESLTVTEVIPLENLEVTDGQTLKGMVIVNDSTVVVSIGNALVRYDLDTGARERYPLSLQAEVGSFVVWGAFYYVRPFDSTVALLNNPNNATQVLLSPQTNTAIIGTMAINSRDDLLYVSYTRYDELETFDLRFQPYVAVIDLTRFEVIDTLHLDVVDSAWHLPSAVTLSSGRTQLYVIYAASNRLSVIDLETRQRAATVTTGSHPVAIGFSRDNSEVFTIDCVGSTLSLFDTQFHFPIDTIPTTTQTLLPDVGRGEQLFYTATDPQIAWNNSTSCNSCHTGQGANAISAVLDPAMNDPNTRQFLREHIVNTQGGTGLSDVDLDALIAYLKAQP